MFLLERHRLLTCAKLLHTFKTRCSMSCSLLQGVLAPADAQLAVRAGVDGIILRCTVARWSLENTKHCAVLACVLRARLPVTYASFQLHVMRGSL